MNKIIMLGTGHGGVTDLYNTCFLLINGNKHLLVDTGGGIEIIKRLRLKDYNLSDIHDVFISHCHTDHLFGLIWILKKLSIMYQNGYTGDFNIYCNKEVANAIKELATLVIQTSFIEALKPHIRIHILENNEKVNIAGFDIHFFDLYSSDKTIYGFDTTLDNGKKLVFLGDIPCNATLYNKIKHSDYVMLEAYCLDSENYKFKAYEKGKCTVKSVCQEMNNLDIKNLILYHTEDTHINKKELYTKEGKMYFANNIIVPNDMEEIDL